jgi:hypothetical protein
MSINVGLDGIGGNVAVARVLSLAVARRVPRQDKTPLAWALGAKRPCMCALTTFGTTLPRIRGKVGET